MYARGQQQQQQQQQVLFSLHSDLKRLSFPFSFGPLLSFPSIAIAFLVALVVGFSWLSLIDFCSHFISLHLILVVFFLSHSNSFCCRIFLCCVYSSKKVLGGSRESREIGLVVVSFPISYTHLLLWFFLV